MQSTTDISASQPCVKVDDNSTSSARTLIQTLPISSIVQATCVPHSQTPKNISPPPIVNTRVEKRANATPTIQNNKLITNAPLPVTPFHIPRGAAAVANIAVPKGKVQAPVIRAASVSHLQTTATNPTTTTQGFISSLSRPSYVVTSTTSPTILQKAGTLNVVPSSYVKPSTMMTVTSRSAIPVTKTSEVAVKPFIINAPKQLLTQTNNQIADRNTAGVLKTNLGVVTIRGSTITPTIQSQSRVSVASTNSQPPKLTTVNVPMLVPTSGGVRKPQTLAPKVITQLNRAPFSVQSIPVSVSHTPSALTMNKKTGAITIGNQTTIPGQSTNTLVRTHPSVVPSNSLITVADIRPTTLSTNLLIQTTKPQNTVPSNANVTAFSAPAKGFMYEAENFQVKRTLVSSTTTPFTSTANSFTTTSVPRHHFNVVTPVNAIQIPRLNPVMVVETPRMTSAAAPSSPNSVQQSSLTIQQYVIPQAAVQPPQQCQVSQQQPVPPTQQSLPPSIQVPRISPVPQQSSGPVKPNASPRPSILRKRDIDGSIAKAQRNLTPLLNCAPTTLSFVPSSPPSPHLPDMSGGQSSNSSSTLSATSSPGIPNTDPESPTHKGDRPQINTHIDDDHIRTAASLIEMSPRKKPRKQQLTATTNNEPKMDDEMEFICDDKIKKEPKSNDVTGNNHEIPKSSSSTSSTSSKKPNISILTGYNHGWKARHHHFLRYTDVKYKEEKKLSVSDIANQKYVTQKINGWKIYHLSARMEDLHDIELEVVDKLSSLLNLFSNSSKEDGIDNKNVIRTRELIMGNMQRSKVISDQLKEAKSQMLKVFNHKKHVSDIINKYASKRTIKKKGKY